jgi:hypothetical protein
MIESGSYYRNVVIPSLKGDQINLLAGENLSAINGKTQSLNEGEYRVHHLEVLRELTDKWKKGMKAFPWQISDNMTLAQLSYYYSQRWSASLTRDWSDSLMTADVYLTKGDKSNSTFWRKRKEYFEDVLGSGGIRVNDTQSALSVVGMNFLLRSAHNKTFVFGVNPDGICASCRGGENGIGDHCNKESVSDELTMLQKASDFGGVMVRSDQVRVQTPLLWNGKFVDDVLKDN